MVARHGRLLSRLARSTRPTAAHTRRHAGAVREGRADRVPRPAARRRARRIEATSRRDRAPLPRRWRAVRGPRQRHEPVGRRRAVEDGIVIALNRLNRILRVDPSIALAVVEPGVDQSRRLGGGAPHGLYYAPDPSSQSVCTIGGNVAFNSGGAHCFRHGMTANHVLGVTAVLADGEVVTSAATASRQAGPDLAGLFVGSEGLFGVALEITLRLLPRPGRIGRAGRLRSLQAAGDAVSRDHRGRAAAGRDGDHGPPGHRGGRGRGPRRLSARRRRRAASSSSRARATEVDAELHAADGDASGAGATDIASPRRRRTARIWKGRKWAFSPSAESARTSSCRTASCRAPGSAKRSRRIQELSAQHGIRVANVFHAGDGNLHPLILFDGREAGAPNAPKRWPPTSCGCASRWAVRSPASTASGSRSEASSADVRPGRHRVHAPAAAVMDPTGRSPTAARCWSRADRRHRTACTARTGRSHLARRTAHAVDRRRSGGARSPRRQSAAAARSLPRPALATRATRCPALAGSRYHPARVHVHGPCRHDDRRRSTRRSPGTASTCRSIRRSPARRDDGRDGRGRR